MDQRIVQLPNIMLNEDGRPIASLEEWRQKRREEVLELFRTYVYGRPPVRRPESMSIAVEAEELAMGGLALRKKIIISYQGPGSTGKLPFVLFVPLKAANRPVPAFVLINNRGTQMADPDRKQLSGFWPAELLIECGYAAAVFQTEDADPDVHDGFRNGVHGLFDPPGERLAGDAWGTIAAWAWGASRVMDALEQEAAVDAGKVALVGHSRGGKTALWAGAEDERFAMIVSNNSGCSGAALSKGKQGEKISDINTSFPHWFAENYKQFNDRDEELPFDQHMLLGLIAPRLLYVSSASEDHWADPESEFLALLAAEPVYQLHGHAGIGTDKMPPAQSPVSGKKLGYHIRTGEHDLTEYDWRCFIDFANANLI